MQQIDEKTLGEIHRTELNMLKDVVALFEKHGLRYSIYCGTLLGAVRHKGFIPWDDDIDLTMPLADYRAFLKLSDELGPQYSVVHMGNSRTMFFNWAKVHDNRTTFMKKKLARYPDNYGVYIDIYPLIGAFSGRTGQKFQNLLLKTAYTLRLAEAYRLVPESNRNYRILKALHAVPFPLRNAAAAFCRRIAMRDPYKHKRTGTIDWAPFEGKYRSEDWKEFTQLPFEDAWFCAPAAYRQILRTMYGDYMMLPPENMRRVHIDDDMIIDMHRSYREYVKRLTARP